MERFDLKQIRKAHEEGRLLIRTRARYSDDYKWDSDNNFGKSEDWISSQIARGAEKFTKKNGWCAWKDGDKFFLDLCHFLSYEFMISA